MVSVGHTLEKLLKSLIQILTERTCIYTLCTANNNAAPDLANFSDLIKTGVLELFYAPDETKAHDPIVEIESICTAQVNI